ncbi:MAG: hypothetical protein IAG13_24230 [Deltaproteobacteria bacterium]|nr:hypothetical protein [Nannocystaceae bacterium]
MVDVPDTARMLADVGSRLANIHRTQVHRDRWPEFEAFDREAYPLPLRRAAAVQWAGRARAEHGSVHQFTQISHALCNARAPLHVLGALARLITDEVRHAELCAKMAHACWPEGQGEPGGVFAWPVPHQPWPDPPRGDVDAIEAWAAEAIAVACCLGETLSRPMLEAIAVVATCPVAEACARQILRDEHLHATFGWETLAWLVPRLGDEARTALHARIGRAFAGFQSSTACGIPVEQLVGHELEIVRGPPNLGTLTDLQYATIFYATIEQEILPALDALGLAWARRS